MLAVAFDTHRLIAHLEARLESALHQYKLPKHGGMLSITLRVPEFASFQLAALPRGSIYWARQENQSLRFAMGKEIFVEASGPNRLLELEAHFSTLSQNWIKLDPENLKTPGLAFIGFSFSPDAIMHNCWQGYANACILVPTLIFERKGTLCQLTFTCNTRLVKDKDEIKRQWLYQALNLFVRVNGIPTPLEPIDRLERIEDIPCENQWLNRVSSVLKAIQSGKLEKVVLTRRIRVKSQQPLQAARSLSWLSAHYQHGVQFAYTATRSTLIGVSPERLVKLQDDKIICDAVAGTACRHPLPSRDNQLGTALLADNKARHEQGLVVNSIIQSLDPLCSSISAPVQPQLLKSSKVQHLWSPIHGRVKPGTSLLKLASRLHPTPAVGGTPHAHAIAWLEDQEASQRGWYTGALGWIGTDGSGELAVVLRCALLHQHFADLFAGAGIVGDSEPEAEFAETEWKLRTMLDALAVI